MAERLGSSSASLKIEAFSGTDIVASSNSLLITNLLDIKTGHNVIRQRYVREAEQSAEQFFAILRELTSGDDDETLKNFLNYLTSPSPSCLSSIYYRGRVPLGIRRGYRSLGEKNLRIFANLHEAVLGFIDRHFRRLKRHTQKHILVVLQISCTFFGRWPAFFTAKQHVWL